MERRKPSKGSIDELALVKAAAWAWYEHGSGSGSEGREVREYDLAMPNKRAPKPSRYKLEAMKESQEAPPKITPPLSPLSTASNSEISLLDDYEIERISKQLDLYIESSRAEHLRSVLGGNHCARNKVASFSESGTTEVKSKPKNKISRGSWLKHYAAICGSRRDDVIEGRIFKVAYLRGGSRKRM